MTEQGGPGRRPERRVAATDAAVIAFTDADCEPAPGWLREAVARSRDGADLVTGPIEPVRPPGPFDRTLHVRGPSVLFESANVIVRRSLLDRIGGFERPARLDLAVEAGHFGEDVVFGWRAVRDGARVEFAPGAVVRHAVFPRDARGFIAERGRLRFFPMLLGEVPELRDSRPWRLFLSPSHRPLRSRARRGRRRAPEPAVAPAPGRCSLPAPRPAAAALAAVGRPRQRGLPGWATWSGWPPSSAVRSPTDACSCEHVTTEHP